MELLAIDLTAVMVVFSIGIGAVVAVRLVAAHARRHVEERTRRILKVERSLTERRSATKS